MRYLTLEELIKINKAVLKFLGENNFDEEKLDKIILQDIVNRPKISAGDYEPFPTLWDKAAAIMEGIAKNRPFNKANAITAFLAAAMFLRLNGYKLESTILDSEHILSIALLQWTLPQITTWLKNKSIKIEK